MAKLLIKTEGLENQTLELRLGVNHVGRDPDCDFPIEHPTVSAVHCKLVLSNDGVLICDCNSTNGTFVNNQPVKEAWLRTGQTVRLGGVKLFVEDTDVTIAIPKFERERPKPPVMLESGSMLCPHHPHAPVTYKCTHCGEVMCSNCVHVLQLQGGQPLFLCPLCSHKCERIGGEKRGKKTFLGILHETVKLRLAQFLGRSTLKK
jgi:pSer/pThr/pTyr-binding forkhead associated (FHA) protein